MKARVSWKCGEKSGLGCGIECGGPSSQVLKVKGKKAVFCGNCVKKIKEGRNETN